DESEAHKVGRRRDHTVLLCSVDVEDHHQQSGDEDHSEPLPVKADGNNQSMRFLIVCPYVKARHEIPERPSHRFQGRLGTLSLSGPCSLPPLSTHNGSLKLWTQGLWCLSWRQPPNPVVDKPEVIGCRQAEEGLLACGTPDAVDSAGGELLTSTGDIVGRWKKYFEELLNPTDLPSSEEAEAGDSEVDSSITQAEVTEVVRKLLGGKAPGVDEIRPEYLKSLDVVGLSWLTHLCNIALEVGDSTSGVGKLGW
ncbi:hypothetical protein L3Q82_014516, partial [Scortum barcoo]